MRLSRIQSQTHSKNQGSIGQNGFDGVLQMLPVAATGLVGLLLTARRVDALALGDDTARGLGVPVRATRVTSRARLGFLAVAVLLSATAVASAGTIGFVGLVAPHAARALGGADGTHGWSRSPSSSGPRSSARRTSSAAR